jgi:hypothetical protein
MVVRREPGPMLRVERAAPSMRPDMRARHQGWRRQAQGDRAARIEAELVIDRWNRRLATGREMLWSPTIRAALIAGTPWLDVLCPGCGTSRAIDLRTVDRHPLASVGMMVLGLPCGSAPMRMRCSPRTAPVKGLLDAAGKAHVATRSPARAFHGPRPMLVLVA